MPNAVTRATLAAVKRAASRIDDVSLDALIRATCRGDLATVAARLARALPTARLATLATTRPRRRPRRRQHHER